MLWGLSASQHNLDLDTGHRREQPGAHTYVYVRIHYFWAERFEYADAERSGRRAAPRTSRNICEQNRDQLFRDELLFFFFVRAGGGPFSHVTHIGEMSVLLQLNDAVGEVALVVIVYK